MRSLVTWKSVVVATILVLVSFHTRAREYLDVDFDGEPFLDNVKIEINRRERGAIIHFDLPVNSENCYIQFYSYASYTLEGPSSFSEEENCSSGGFEVRDLGVGLFFFDLTFYNDDQFFSVKMSDAYFDFFDDFYELPKPEIYLLTGLKNGALEVEVDCKANCNKVELILTKSSNGQITTKTISGNRHAFTGLAPGQYSVKARTVIEMDKELIEEEIGHSIPTSEAFNLKSSYAEKTALIENTSNNTEIIIDHWSDYTDPHNDDPKYEFVSTEDGGMLIPAAPNSGQVSYNTMKSIQINGDLKILNGFDSTPSEKPAKLIVIEADKISIKGELSLLGAKADILFVQRNVNGVLNCYSCDFRGFDRVTLAVAQNNIDHYSTDIEYLKAIERGIIRLSGNVTAPGIKSLELISDRVITDDAKINTTVKVNPDPNGGYVIDQSGSQVANAGSVTAYLGPLVVDYESGEVVKKHHHQTALRNDDFTGEFKTGDLKVVASVNSLTIKADIDFSTEVVVSDLYKNELYVPSETFTINVFHEDAGHLIFESIDTKGTIDLWADGKLSIPSGKKLFARELKGVVGKSFFNRGEISANGINIVAENVINHGVIGGAYYSMIVATDGNIHNLSEINGTNIVLDARKGAVINGTKLDLGDGKVIGNFANGNDILSYRQGTIFSGDDWSYPSTSKAHIHGRNIDINSKFLHNVSSYYVKNTANADWYNSAIPFDRTRVQQVSIQAENSLNINASQHLINSSSLIGVNMPHGTLSITAGLLRNERFAVASTLKKNSAQNQYESVIYAVAPPSSLYSFGKATLNIDTNFINDLSFFEVFGNAELNIPSIRSIGIAQGAFDQLRTTDVRDECVLPATGETVSCLNSWAIAGYNRYQMTIANASYGYSLFHIHDQEASDNPSAISSEPNFNRYNSFQAILTKAQNQFRARYEYPPVYFDSSNPDYYRYGTVRITSTRAIAYERMCLDEGPQFDPTTGREEWGQLCQTITVKSIPINQLADDLLINIKNDIERVL